MEILNQEVPQLLQDLKVTIKKSSMVFPSKETEKKSLFLSNIDKVLNFDVKRVNFFAPHKDFPPHVVAQKLKNALADALVPYDFLAGRLKQNAETGRLEIGCNGAGAGFVVASSECKLDQIGDLVYPNPAFAQLVHKNKDFLHQVTSFECGGFAIGFSTNHTTVDGLSFKTFLDNLAALAANKTMVVTPSHDRHLLAARSPPRVTFPHPELLQSDNLPKFSLSRALIEQLEFKVFQLTFENITSLREKAKAAARITSFNVVTAHVWRCKASSGADDPTRSSTVLYAVDIRQRLNPPLPKSFAGNAILTAYATAKCKELEEGPFPTLVEMVNEGALRMTDVYARSAIDWGERYNGFPHGDVLVSSWWRLGFAEVEYPWEKPKYSCPVVYHRKEIILFFPAIDGGDGSMFWWLCLIRKWRSSKATSTSS